MFVFKDKLPNNCFKPLKMVCLVVFFKVLYLPLPVSGSEVIMPVSSFVLEQMPVVP